MQALPPFAQALPPGCACSVRFLQKQSQLLVLGLSLEFDKKNFLEKLTGKLGVTPVILHPGTDTPVGIKNSEPVKRKLVCT